MTIQLVSAIPDGYYALMVSILRGVSPDEAAELLDGGQISAKARRARDLEIVMLRDCHNMTYGEIGRIYGLNPGAVYRRIKRLKEKTEREGAQGRARS